MEKNVYEVVQNSGFYESINFKDVQVLSLKVNLSKKGLPVAVAILSYKARVGSDGNVKVAFSQIVCLLQFDELLYLVALCEDVEGKIRLSDGADFDWRMVNKFDVAGYLLPKVEDGGYQRNDTFCLKITKFFSDKNISVGQLAHAEKFLNKVVSKNMKGKNNGK